MSPLLGRPPLEGPALTGRALLLLVALLLASAPVSQLLTGSSWLLLTMLAAAPVILGGVVLRAVLRHRWLVPLAQVALLAVLLLMVETVLGLAHWQEGPLEVAAAQPLILRTGLVELASSVPPLALGAHGTVIVVLLIGLAAMALDLMFLDLGWHTPTALLLMSSLLIPALQQPAGGYWWQVAGPVLAGGAILATRTVHADPRYLLGDRRPQAGPTPQGGRTLAAVLLCLVLVAAMTPVLGTALPRVAEGRLALDISALQRWQDPDAPALGAVMIDDDVSVRRSLLDQGDAEVLRYSSTAEKPSYLRLRTLNSFDGEAFRSTRTPPELGTGPAAFSDARTDGVAVSGGRGDFERNEYEIVSLGGDRLPVPEAVRSVEGADRSLDRAMRVQPVTGEVALTYVPSGLRGKRYDIETEPRTSTPDELRAVDPGVFEQPFATGYISHDEVPLAATSLAEQIVRSSGADNGYDTAIAFQEHFRSSFAYSLTVSSPPGRDPLESFLEDRIGYCEQFAAVFALMMTSQGYPTRVVIGFTPGERDGDEWSVRSRNAHAWPEVWFGPAHGWVRFEPTPAAAANGVRPPDLGVPAAAEDTPEPAPETPTAEGATSAAPAEEPSSATDEQEDQTTTSAQAADGGPGAVIEQSTGEGGAVVPLLVLGGALLAVVAAVPLPLRRRRLHARELRWEPLRVPADGGAAGPGDGAGAEGPTTGAAEAEEAAEALAAERRTRRAGALAWDEIGQELAARTTAIRWLRFTRAWGPAPTPLALDPALPPHRALEVLLDRIGSAEHEVTAEHRAAAARIADAHVAATYAAPLPEEPPTEPGPAPAPPAGQVMALSAPESRTRGNGPQITPGSSLPSVEEAGLGEDVAPESRTRGNGVRITPGSSLSRGDDAGLGGEVGLGEGTFPHPLRDDADQLLELIRAVR